MQKMDMKLYPKTSRDDGGIKFYFDHQELHFTIRPAWKPMLILEAKFKELGGKNFKEAYETTKDWKWWQKHHPEASILKEAVDKVNEFLTTLDTVSQMGKSPFVVYIKSRNEFKS